MAGEVFGGQLETARGVLSCLKRRVLRTVSHSSLWMSSQRVSRASAAKTSSGSNLGYNGFESGPDLLEWSARLAGPLD